MNIHLIDGHYLLTLREQEMEALWELVEIALSQPESNMLPSSLKQFGQFFQEKARQVHETEGEEEI